MYKRQEWTRNPLLLLILEYEPAALYLPRLSRDTAGVIVTSFPCIVAQLVSLSGLSFWLLFGNESSACLWAKRSTTCVSKRVSANKSHDGEAILFKSVPIACASLHFKRKIKVEENMCFLT